jgi:hypothetical protein
MALTLLPIPKYVDMQAFSRDVVGGFIAPFRVVIVPNYRLPCAGDRVHEIFELDNEPSDCPSVHIKSDTPTGRESTDGCRKFGIEIPGPVGHIGAFDAIL